MRRPGNEFAADCKPSGSLILRVPGLFESNSLNSPIAVTFLADWTHGTGEGEQKTDGSGQFGAQKQAL